MLVDRTINELTEGLRQKDFTIADLVEECYVNIEKYNSDINAFVTIRDKDEVLREAKEKNKNLQNAKSFLFGLPFIIKDSKNTKGIRTTCASNVLKNYFSPYNATVYQKLIDAGAILIGKTNMDAWGHGASSENTD